MKTPRKNNLNGYFSFITEIFSVTSQRCYFFFLTILLCGSLNAQVSGTVFNDFDQNGVPSAMEVGYPGITVTGYGADGTVYGPVTSDAVGQYLLPGVNQPTRIEFTWPSPGPEPSVFGGSTVQFVSGAANSIMLGVHDPDYYCDSGNPDLALTCFVNGAATGTSEAIITMPWNSSGTSPTISNDGNVGQVGSVWGTAYDRPGQKLYTAAFLKRHVQLGNDLGSIYLTDYTGGASTSGTPIINISNVGSITGRNLGTVGPNDPSRDDNAFTQIGKIGLGGIEVSRDGSMLWVVNLNTKSIVPVDLSGANAMEGTPLSIPNPGCTGNTDDWRPFGLKYHNNALYVGGVCSGETGGAGTMRYYVYAYDLAAGTWSGALIDESLQYPKGYAFKFECDEWNPWISQWSEILYVEGDHDMCHPQAMLSDISFDIDGDMVLHFMDRLGHQAGAENQCTAGCTDNNLYTAVVGGDILRANYDGTSWTMETGGLIGSNGCGTSGTNNGTAVAEYYCGDFFDRTIQNIGFGDHFETMQGSGAILFSSGEIATIAIDPLDVNSAGLIFMNNGTGGQTDQAEIYNTGFSTGGTFAKANGLGELDLLCAAAPVEIGNLVWNDTDGDGVQDANEPGISGVQVELYDPVAMSVVATATTDGSGNYIFSTGAGTSSGSQIYNLNLNYSATYQVRIVNAEGGSQQSPLNNLEITSQNSDSSANGDIRDSDGSDANTSIVSFTLGAPGEHDHTYDFGFRPESIMPPTGDCDCQEYLYLNDVLTGEVHKFEIDPVGGDITEIGNPWMSGFTNPHGIAADLNGNLYIGDDPMGPIYTMDSEGGTVATDATVWNSTVGQGLTNMGSIGNYIFANGGFNMINEERERIQVIDACSGDRIGSICLEGATGLDWGMQVLDDGTILYTEGIDVGIGFVPTRSIWKFDFDPSQINNSPNCIPKLTEGGYLNDYSEIYGITSDGDHLYMVGRKGGAANTFIVKADATDGSFVAELQETTMPGTNAANPGFAGARGIIYAPSSGMLYVSGIEDCISIVRASDLTYIGAGAGIVNPANSEPKAIGLLKECCPTGMDQMIDVSFCSESVGETIFLQDLLTCEGIVAEGMWTETSNDSNGGIEFEPCDLSIMISAAGCATYVLEKNTMATGNQRCNEFGVTVTVCSLIPEAELSTTEGTCDGSTPNDDATISIANAMNADAANISAGSTYSGPAYGGAGQVAIVGMMASLSGLMHNNEYTVRIFNGSNDCFVDYTVTTPAINCSSPCINPSVTLTPSEGSCSGTTPNNDASIAISGIMNADEANYSTGGSYTGPAYNGAGAIDLSGGSGSISGLMHGTAYTVRVFNGANDCFTDYPITTPTISCGPDCEIDAISMTSNQCVDNSTPGNPSDDRVQVGIFVSGSGSTYTLSVDGGTTITPSSGTIGSPGFFLLGPGTAGSGNVYTITVIDAADPSCNQTLVVQAPENCESVFPCPTKDCGGITIQKNE